MKAREQRHDVAVPARLRMQTGWTDATILNLSARGLMFRTQERLERGHFLELRRGNHVIVARVVWSDGKRCGARAQDVLPVRDIIHDKKASRAASPAIEPRAATRTVTDRADAARRRGRSIEFFIFGMAVACSAFLIAEFASTMLAAPLARVEIALAR